MTAIARRRRLTGHPVRWALELPLLCAWPYLMLAAISDSLWWHMAPVWAQLAWTHMIAWGLVGLCMPALLDGLRRRVPLHWLVVAAPVFGGMVGASAALAAPFADSYQVEATFVIGACTFGLTWLPNTFLTMTGRSKAWFLLGLPFVLAAAFWIIAESAPVLPYIYVLY
ncbi:MAG: hypothetical protein H6739_40445 [Alphaproteobacteria bacterium]|nr:hypothetical protein [Alphaproteobacteria bacterium]